MGDGVYRGKARKPLRKRWPIFLVGLIGLVAAGYLYAHKPPNPDQAIFDYIGWIGSEGGHYYKDVAEQNFPGEMLLHDFAFRIFGTHYWAYRTLDYLLLLVGAASLVGLLKRAGQGTAAWAAGAAYVIGYISSNGWMAGQRDPVAANLLLMAAYLFVLRLRGRGRGVIAPIGPVLFLALLLRPTFVMYVVALPVLDFWWRKETGRKPGTRILDTLIIVGAMVGCLGILLGWGAAVGSLPDFREQAIQFNVQAYQAGHSRMDTALRLLGGIGVYVWFLPAMIAALAWMRAGERKAAPIVLLLGLAALSLVSALVQNKGFGYHLGAILAPVFALAGLGMWRAANRLSQWRTVAAWQTALALAVFLLPVAGYLKQVKSLGPQLRLLFRIETESRMLDRETSGQAGLSWGQIAQLSAYARENTGPDETILVWGRPVGIHLLAKRRSSTRFITSGMLLLARPPFTGASKWIAEFDAMLARRAPRLVMIEAQDGVPVFNPLDTGAGEHPMVKSLREAIRDRYRFVRAYGSMQIFRLNAP